MPNPPLEDEDAQQAPGGFLTEADAIVQPFHLPRFQHGTYQPFSSSTAGDATKVEFPSGTSTVTGTAAERDGAADKVSSGLTGTEGLPGKSEKGGKIDGPASAEIRTNLNRVLNLGSGSRSGDARANPSNFNDDEGAHVHAGEHMEEQGKRRDAGIGSDSGVSGGEMEDMEEVFPPASVSLSFDGNGNEFGTGAGTGAEIGSGSGSRVADGMPKSLLEHAEERLRMRDAGNNGSPFGDGGVNGDGDGDVDEGAVGGEIVAPARTNANGRALRSGGRAAKFDFRAPVPTSTSGKKKKPRQAAKTKRKSTKRKRDAESESLSALSSELNEEAGSVEHDSSSDLDQEADEDKDLESRSRRAKSRASASKSRRQPARSKASQPPPAPSTRVLRTRTPKSPEKRKAEEEAEVALKEAGVE